MSIEKCKLRLSRDSKLCATLIPKEFLILVCLMNEEEPGLRVSDIHSILGGNKSWVSNRLSHLAIAGLALSKRDGREIYYKLSAQGTDVAFNALALIESLVKTENLDFILCDNTYLLEPNFIHGNKSVQELRKIGYPLYTHKGTILLNKIEKYFFFVGNDRKGRPFTIECALKNIQKVEQNFDAFYKQKYSTRIKPLIIDYKISCSEEIINRIYFFIKYQTINRSSENFKWLNMLNGQINQFQDKNSKTPLLENDKDIISMA